jgi:gluconate 5-dehydrogenase
MSDGRPLAGRVAIVTGGGKGIGAAVAEALAADGAELALVGRDGAALEERAGAIDAAYPGRATIAVACDVTDEAAVAAMTADVVARFGRIDILVNTAGGTGPIETPASEYPADEFLGILRLNVLGTFLPCKHAIPGLRGSAVTATGAATRPRSGPCAA